MPRVLGVSKKTLTEDNELFLFDDESEPILQVLCGKTLEVSRMEVLQEEELKEMAKQQQNFANLMESDKNEIEKMEDQEKKRLEAYEAKKQLELSRRNSRKIAHEKLVSRTIAKSYLRDLKPSSYVFLKDICFIRDEFKEVTMHQDVLPWLFSQSEVFVKQIENFDRYPNSLIAKHIDDASVTHIQCVNQYIQKIQNIRHAEVKAEEDKLAAKYQRQLDRLAKRKREQIGQLKSVINSKFVDKLGAVENIVLNDFVDIDGWNKDATSQVTVLGGFLGQIIIILNAVCKDFAHLDKPVTGGKYKSNARASQDSRPKTPVSELSGKKSEQHERQLLTAVNIQTFIFNYISEKLKTEKLSLRVDHRFETFLSNMPMPLALNQMRTMKEPNYAALRELISKHMGNPVLEIIKNNQEALGLDPDIFALVYEGFWDLYTFKPKVQDISAKKLSQWIGKINLITTQKSQKQAEADAAEAEQKEKEEEEEVKEGDAEVAEGENVVKPSIKIERNPCDDPIDPYPAIDALVRIRIPKAKPEPEVDDEGNVIPMNYNEDELEEIPFEDRCATIETCRDDKRIWAINQQADRAIRQDLATEMRGIIDRLEAVDLPELFESIEEEAIRFEKAFVELFEEDPNSNSTAPKVPVFDFKPLF